MPRQLKATHIHFEKLVFPCELHGDHTVIVAGLDHMAGMVADNARDALAALGFTCTRYTQYIPLEHARAIVAQEGLDIDDLPF